MNPLALTFALIKIPRLFLSLFLFPLLLGLLVLILQFFLSAILFTGISNEKSVKVDKDVVRQKVEQQQEDWIRERLIGASLLNKIPIICHWKEVVIDGTPTLIREPAELCESVGRYDVVIKPQVLQQFPIDQYKELFKGKFEKIHICRFCNSDIEISLNDGEVSTELNSFWAIILFRDLAGSEKLVDEYVKIIERLDTQDAAIGERFIRLPGTVKSTKLSLLTKTLIIIANICIMILTALWLALKAHRKVLDYFSRSGTLLPLVAATGRSTFYSALWILTFFRVGAFLIASVPLGIVTFASLTDNQWTQYFFDDNYLLSGVWFLTLIGTLVLSTLIASIADLKQHHNMSSFLFKYVPLFFCFFGGILWGATFLVETNGSEMIRNIILLIPLVGAYPILMAPIFSPPVIVLALNLLFTSILLGVAARYNSRWFASHLEQI